MVTICSAKYTEFIKRDKQAREIFKKRIKTVSDCLEFDLRLGQEEAVLKFTEAHLFDIQQTVTVNKVSNQK